MSYNLVVGNWGHVSGIVAQQFAAKHPQWLKALILVDTTSHGVGQIGRSETALAAIDDLGNETAIQNVAAGSFGPGASPALVDWAKREVSRTPGFVARAAIESINKSDTRPLLSQISVPTLVIVGEHDAITPPTESYTLNEGIPDSNLVVIDNAGHFPMLEQPREFNRVVRGFLKRHAI